MKKILYIFIGFISIFIFNIEVSAKKISVELKQCIDGDTAIFRYDNTSFKARFLAIDTPETEYSSKGEQPFGDIASKYTCEKLEKAKKIELEYDKNSSEKDKYDRHLVWVWVDGNLLQKEIVKKGYAKVTYLYDDYKYTDELKQEEKIAKEKEIGIWSNSDKETTNTNNKYNNSTSNYILFNEDVNINFVLVFILVVCIVIGTLLSTKKSKKKI